jgi:hypothetical protein
MTEISRISGSTPRSPDPTLEPEELTCQADPSPDEASAPLRGENNADRTKIRAATDPYADAGLNSSMDALFAGFALVKSHSPQTGLDTEVLSASAQVGGEMEAQASLARMGVSSERGELGVEVMTARYHGGAHNDDGSTGFNVGACGVLVGVEGTANLGDGGSVTLGASLSKGAGLSVGVRDQDHDGRTEWCFKVSTPAITLGACIED